MVEVVTSRDVSADVVVRQFVAAAGDGSDTSTVTEALARLRQARKLQRHAWVTMWGLRSTQQLLWLPAEGAADLEELAIRQARTAIAPLETGGDGATVVVAPVADVPVGSERRREVSLVAVSNADVRDHLQPVVDAGFIVDGVGTPALALAALARRRRDGRPGATAYLALGARATCLAVVRDGVLLYGREMPWGHAGAAGEAIDERMSADLRRSLVLFERTFGASVHSVVLCGDRPNLRGVTQPLSDALGVPVEALDSLAGLDADAVQDQVGEFHTHVAALRIAIAAGADLTSTTNLLPLAIRMARARTERLRIAAAVLVGLLLAAGWFYMVRSATPAEQDEPVVSVETQADGRLTSAAVPGIS